MNSPVKIWFLYSLIGFASALTLTLLFERYPNIRFFSNEAIIAVMFATMLPAINKAFKVASKIGKTDDSRIKR